MQLVLNFPVASHGVGQEFSIRRQAARVEASLHTDGDYTPQFLLKHMGKDLRLALASAGTAPLPQTQALMKPYQTAIERGLGDDNFADLRVNRQAQRLSPNSFCWRETPKIAYSGRVRLRILDKYLLREFAWPLIYSFDAFLLLFVVHDLLENLSEFLRQHARIGMILRYYLIVLPEPIVFILPLAVLLGVLFCLSMLGRHNELLAMRASGVSIWRLGLPFFVVGAIASAAAFGVSEKFVPQSRERAESLQRQMRGLPAVLKRQNFFFSNSQDRRDWYAREFDPEQNVMEDVAFYVRTSDGKPVMDMFARRAVWTEKRWRFEDARLVQPPAADVYVAATNFPFITETPKRLIMESKHYQEMTSTELRRFARSLRYTGRASQQAPYLVEMHGRYAMPLTCLIVIVLGVPLGMQVSRRGPMMGVGLALVSVVAFFILTRLSLQLGHGGRVPPVMAAWLPNAIFGTIGAILLWRAR